MILAESKQQMKEIQALYKHILIQVNEAKSWLLYVSGCMFDKEDAESLEDGYNTCIELEREDYNNTYKALVNMINDFFENNKFTKKQYIFLNNLLDTAEFANKEMNSFLDNTIIIMAYKKSK